jgi:hypothetical protein
MLNFVCIELNGISSGEIKSVFIGSIKGWLTLSLKPVLPIKSSTE